MRVMVCGGAGYIGTQFVRFLLRRTSHEVVILDSLEASEGKCSHVDTEENFRKKHPTTDPATAGRRFAILHVGDVRNEKTLDAVFTQYGPIDVVVHMCAYIVVSDSVTDPLSYYDNNVIGAIRLLQAMRRHHCDKMIFSSTAALFGNVLRGRENVDRDTVILIEPDAKIQPESPYGTSKYMDELILRDCAAAYGIKSVCLRYFNACGADEEGDVGETHDPETHLIPRVLAVALADRINAYNARHHPDRAPVPGFVSVFGTDYNTPDGTCIRDYVHVTDLSRAHALAIDYLAKLTPVDRDKFFLAVNLGTGRGYSVRQVIESARRVTGHPIPVREEPRRAGDPPLLLASGEAAKRILGWKPEYDSIDKVVASAWKFHSTHLVKYESEQ